MKDFSKNYQHRQVHPALGWGDDAGGFFVVGKLRVIASNGSGWDHISVSLPDRCPTWDEMEKIRRMFFQPEECVMQLHPPVSRYVDAHPFCLHLWRPQGEEIPQPPTWMVGPGGPEGNGP